MLYLITSTSKSLSFLLPFDNIIIDFVYGALIGLLIWFLAGFPATLQQNKSLKCNLVDPASFDGETFQYKGKSYDRKGYLSSRTEDYKKYKGNSPKIMGRTSFLKGQLYNGGNKAILAELDIAALKRLY